jgi:hypothetical protein
MITKQDIDNKFAEQKADLLAHLATEIKLPITEIEIKYFNKNTFVGQFSVTIDRNKKQLLTFKYENKTFIWDITTIKNNLESIWSKVFIDNKPTITQKILNDLHIDTDNADRISHGQINIVYVYEKNSPNPVAVIAEYDKKEWIVHIQ